MFIVPEQGKLTEWQKINIVKGFMEHYHFVKVGDYYDWQFDDLVKGKVEALKSEYIARKADEKAIKERRKEINILLKNELLSEKKRTKLISEFNEIGLKYFGNHDDEIYEAIKAAQVIVRNDENYLSIHDVFWTLKSLILNHITVLFGVDKEISFKVETKHLVNLILTMKYMSKCYGFNSVYIALNAIILQMYDEFYREYAELLTAKEKDDEDSQLLEYLKKPIGISINLYSLFVRGLEKIDIHEFIQVFPLKKCYQDDGCKNYYSSVKALKEYAHDTRFLFSELYFDEPVLFVLQCKMFSVMEYDTGLDTLDLLVQFLNEPEDKKSKFKVIK